LDGITDARNVRLRRKVQFGAKERAALGDENLRAHEINARDHFSHRVLDLDARVHFDEAPFLPVHVVKELDRPGVIVPNVATHADCRLTQSLANFVVHPNGRRDLDHFLVPALDRAIAFVQVQHLAVLITENLNLEVFGPWNVFFQEDRGVAECTPGLTARFIQQMRKLRSFIDHAHAPTPATECRFDDQRETDLVRHAQSFGAFLYRIFRAGQDRNVELLCERARGDFVAH
jgi:hypothetical protein